MLTAPASNRQVTSFSFSRSVIQTVERVEEALARHLEHVVDALGDERVRQYAPARAGSLRVSAAPVPVPFVSPYRLPIRRRRPDRRRCPRVTGSE